MKFRKFVGYLQKLENESSRLLMNDILAELLDDLKSQKSPDIEIQAIMYMLQGRLTPGFFDLTFSLSSRSVEEILVRLFGEEKFKEAFSKHRDYGDTYFSLAETSRSKVETVAVYQALLRIAKASGGGSKEAKIIELRKLLKGLTPLEGKYVIRIVLEHMRVGVEEKTMLEALSKFLVGDKTLVEELERKFGIFPDLGSLASGLLNEGVVSLKKVELTPGTPVKVKLVQRASNAEDIIQRHRSTILQPKYDGIRCQIHRGGVSKVRGKEVWRSFVGSANEPSLDLTGGERESQIFTRNMKEVSEMFPEIVEFFTNLPAILGDFIFDAEIVSVDPETGDFLPFQETMKRRRKYDISAKMSEVPILVYVFDVLMLKGVDYTDKPLVKRLEILDSVDRFFKKTFVSVSEHIVVDNEEVLDRVFKGWVASGLEGLIAKLPGSSYRVGTRNYDWIKLKRASVDGLSDTIDVVLMGYYLGKGRRGGFGIGSLLVGVLGPDQQSLVTVAKVGTGVSDDQWGEILSVAKKYESENMPVNYKISKNMFPDVFVEPKVVCEVEADEITKSSVHTSGYALRFPRLKKFNRRDKALKDIDDVRSLRELHKSFIKLLSSKS